jgi:hypothetical protein
MEYWSTGVLDYWVQKLKSEPQNARLPCERLHSSRVAKNSQAWQI